MSDDSTGDTPIIWGGRETWPDVADRAQRMFGDGSRTFVCKQVGAEQASPSFVMILVPGPRFAELTREVADALIAEGGIPNDPNDPPKGTVIG